MSADEHGWYGVAGSTLSSAQRWSYAQKDTREPAHVLAAPTVLTLDNAEPNTDLISTSLIAGRLSLSSAAPWWRLRLGPPINVAAAG